MQRNTIIQIDLAATRQLLQRDLDAKSSINSGKWTSEEKAIFERSKKLVNLGYKSGQRNWKYMAAAILPKRTECQVRSHAQKFQ